MTKKIKLKISARLARKKIRRLPSLRKKTRRFSDEAEFLQSVDYKNADFLRKFLTERGKILPSRISGLSARHQRLLSKEIRKARTMALLPFCAEYQ